MPTLGTRPEFLLESLKSIRAAGDCEVVVVRPAHAHLGAVADALIDTQIDDPEKGLAAAINVGVRSFSSSVRHASWLGDDDRLIAGSLSLASRRLSETNAAAVFGQCRYIDSCGKQVWMNRSGNWATFLMMFGPQLVPQPGSLFKVAEFEAVGGLDEDLKWAFDLDMFLKLKKRPGGLRFIKAPLAEFRWHGDSLTVGSRKGSVREASEVRKNHLPTQIRTLSKVWEPVLRQMILRAGNQMNHRLLVRGRVSN